MLSYIYRAVLFPAKRAAPSRLGRYFLSLPIIFDLISMMMQLFDLSKVFKLKGLGKLGDSHFDEVRDYNAGVTVDKKITTTRRAEEYYAVLVIPQGNVEDEKLLIVGPRNVQELFIAWTFGFRWKNIVGIDLYSTNAKIIEMNMEKMTFPDSSFDAISMANTLSYAKSTRTALSEVARVLKPGGRFAFSATYDPNERWSEDAVSGAEIKAILDDLNLRVYVHYSADKINALGRTQTSHTFAVKKSASSDAKFDDFHI